MPSSTVDDDDLAEILEQVTSQPVVPVPLAAPEDDGPLPIPQETPAPTTFAPPESDDGDDFDSILDSMGSHQEANATDIMKAWMNYHKFVVVETLEELTEIVNQALKAGKCSLDLETEGLDNRIYWKNPADIKEPVEYWGDVRPALIPTTVHKIVGYCLCYDGYTGYYVPVRHNAVGDEVINVDPLAAGREIKRLCLASQPVISEEGKKSDPLGSPLLAKPGKVKLYFWHAKFDQEFLFPVTGIDFWHPESFEDGLLIYYCIFTGDKSLGLKEKAKANLVVTDSKGNTVRGHIKADPKNPLHELVEEDPKGAPIQYEMIKLKDLFVRGREIKFATLKPSEARYYACSDAICTFLLCDNPGILSVTKDKRYANIYRLEKQVGQVLRWMERLRIKVDHEYVRTLLIEAKQEAESYRDQIVSLAQQYGFNSFDPQSTQQLSNFLFANPTGLNIEPKPDKTSAVGSQQYKTDADTLEKLVEEHPDINPILLIIVKYRQIEKVIGTYLNGMLNNCDANQELRYQFKQTGAPTGRFTAPAGEASQGYGAIPIHGIPSTYDDKKPKVATALRKAFVARDGYTMVKIDFAGEELRIVTNLSREPAWIKEFLEGTGDLHTITAKAFFGETITKQQRQFGKMANFSLVYGGGTMAIMRATKCTQQEAARRKSAFDKSMPIFAEWVKKQKAAVKRDKGVYSAFGRWMAVPDVDSPDKAVVAACERYSLNYPIQGCICSVSQVLTNRGYQTVGDLVTRGESFTTWTGSKWATAVAKPMGSCRLAELTLSDGTIVRCDTRHKQLEVSSEGYQWVDFDYLTEGLMVATSLCYPVEFSPPALPKMGKRIRSRNLPKIQNLVDFWYWMGRYIGDGGIDPRGAVRYSFGSHERVAINRCLEFWNQCGLDPKESNATHTPKNKRSIRYSVEVCSVDLVDWLAKLGFNPATAHTKRLPACILQETLEHRKSFIRGVMDSDGHKPPMVSAKGNPYNIHLCQRPLLEDLKLLLRTLGVESIIRGPYRSGSDKNGEDTTSYRLDLNRRMFERNVQGVSNRGPKFHDMFAPDFLVKDFLSRGKWVTSDFRDNSSYVLYRRLVNGGRVTVYTLDDLCKQVGVTLRSPIYGHKKIKKIKILDQVEETYTLSVQDPLHRFEADGVITKNSGADIMKMVMVMLYKRFHKMGWIQDNSARFMLTVHDEIVFEIKHEKLMEIVPVITDIMCSPSKMAKDWAVPLEVEPLLDLHWDPKYDYYKIMHGYIPEKGKSPKKTDVQVGERYYQQVPPWLEGILVPDYKRKGEVPQSPPAQEPPPSNPSPPVSNPPTQEAQAPVSNEVQTPSQAPPARTHSTPPTNGKAKPETNILVYHVSPYNLTTNTVKQVSAACMKCRDQDGKVLHLIDSGSNETLVDPALKIMVNQVLFKLEMDNHNL
jgi:DNA polymerase I-like protein with 3'-5' exonuclease and polymerase domains